MPGISPAFIGDQDSGKTVFAGLLYDAAEKLSRRSQGAIRIKAGLNTADFHNKTVVRLRGGEWPDPNIVARIIDFGLIFPRLIGKPQQFDVRFADLAGPKVQEVLKEVFDSKDPGTQLVKALAGKADLNAMFDANVVVHVVDSERMWKDTSSEYDSNQAIYLRAIRLYKEITGTRLKAVFIVLTKFDLISPLVRGATTDRDPAEHWMRVAKHTVSEKMLSLTSETFNMEAPVSFLPVWVDVDQNNPRSLPKPPPEHPLSYSRTVPHFLQMLGTLK